MKRRRFWWRFTMTWSIQISFFPSRSSAIIPWSQETPASSITAMRRSWSSAPWVCPWSGRIWTSLWSPSQAHGPESGMWRSANWRWASSRSRALSAQPAARNRILSLRSWDPERQRNKAKYTASAFFTAAISSRRQKYRPSTWPGL